MPIDRGGPEVAGGRQSEAIDPTPTSKAGRYLVVHPQINYAVIVFVNSGTDHSSEDFSVNVDEPTAVVFSRAHVASLGATTR